MAMTGREYANTRFTVIAPRERTPIAYTAVDPSLGVRELGVCRWEGRRGLGHLRDY